MSFKLEVRKPMNSYFLEVFFSLFFSVQFLKGSSHSFISMVWTILTSLSRCALSFSGYNVLLCWVALSWVDFILFYFIIIVIVIVIVFDFFFLSFFCYLTLMLFGFICRLSSNIMHAWGTTFKYKVISCRFFFSLFSLFLLLLLLLLLLITKLYGINLVGFEGLSINDLLICLTAKNKQKQQKKRMQNPHKNLKSIHKMKKKIQFWQYFINLL